MAKYSTYDDEQLRALWNEFADTPIDNDDRIDREFLHFPKGTYRFEIWHWFDIKYSTGIRGLTNLQR